MVTDWMWAERPGRVDRGRRREKNWSFLTRSFEADLDPENYLDMLRSLLDPLINLDEYFDKNDTRVSYRDFVDFIIAQLCIIAGSCTSEN